MFQLNQVVPWGRSFDEYVAMFALSGKDLAGRILGCGDGPASFNAELTRRGGSVVSVDPLYLCGPDEIRSRIRQTTPIVLEQTRQSADSFVWDRIRSIEHLRDVRLSAMEQFLADLRSPASRIRYHAGALPALPYRDATFTLALCSHFLFLYSSMSSLDFHVDSIAELCRVATEARIFPLLALDGRESPYVGPAARALRERGFTVDTRRVAYEFQRGGNQMLVVRGPSPVILHIASAAAWNEAHRRGVYVAESFDREGFIHCSTPEQVLAVANRLFHGRRDLFLLYIDVASLDAPLRYENLEGGSELFPHVYGPLPISAIARAALFEPGASGRFSEQQLSKVLGSREES